MTTLDIPFPGTTIPDRAAQSMIGRQVPPSFGRGVVVDAVIVSDPLEGDLIRVEFIPGPEPEHPWRAPERESWSSRACAFLGRLVRLRP